MLVNLTKGKVLSEKVEIADSFFKRALGLMFRKSYDGALLFPLKGKTLFHGFFCNFPILLICLKEGRVICKKVLQPWGVEEVEGDVAVELDGRREVDVDVGDEVRIVEDRSNEKG